MLQLPTETSTPLFTNDTLGVIRLVLAFVFVVLLPLASLVVYFLKRGPDQRITVHESITEKRFVVVEAAMNGLGTRVNEIQGSTVRLDERVNGIYQLVASSQQEIMMAIRASAEAQIKAVHSVELEVARLQERNDLGEALQDFGRIIGKVITDKTNG